MGFGDWRRESKLLERVLEKLSRLGCEIANTPDQPLLATKKLKRAPPHDYGVLLAFPERYPLHDIRAHLVSADLKERFIDCPIKHLSPPVPPLHKRFLEDGVLEVCLRGPWSTRDFTDPAEVLQAVDEWVRDYVLGETFPEDFDFPENVYFVPAANIDRTLFIDEFFLRPDQPYLKWDSPSFGIFHMAVCDKPRIGLLTKLIDYSGAASTASVHRELAGKDALFLHLAGEPLAQNVVGLWGVLPSPPPAFAFLSRRLPFPADREAHLWEILWAQRDVHTELDGHFLFLLFFPLFGKPAAIFTLVMVTDSAPAMADDISKVTYLKPHVLSPRDLYARLGRSVSFERLRTSAIAMLGVGALGSQVALHLARTGFQKITVIDKEILLPGNVMRHTGSLSHAGQPKTQVLQKQITAVNPHADVAVFTKDVTAEDFDFNSLKGTLVISTLGDDRVEQYVNWELCARNIPAVYGRTTTTSYACRIIRVRPHEDACLKCLEYYRLFRDHRYISLGDERITREDLVFEGCTAPSFLGANVDIALYASLVARVAFNETGAGLDRFTPQLKGNHFVFASRLVAEEPAINQAFRLIEQTFAPLKGCPQCGYKEAAYRCVVMSQEALDKISTLSLASNGIETGGVLIGCPVSLDDGVALVICHATLPGEGAIRTPAYFDRDKEYCGKIVNAYHTTSDGVLNYVGEWHSHPGRDTRPSSLDNASLFLVARDRGYTINSPVSLIQSAVDRNLTRTTVYRDNARSYDETLVIAPLVELRRSLTCFVPDLDPLSAPSSCGGGGQRSEVLR